MADTLSSLNGGGSLVSYTGNRLQLLGVNTGYDTKALLDMELATIKLKDAPLTTQQKKYKVQQTSWLNFQSLIDNLKTKIETLQKANQANRTTTMDLTGFANVTADGKVPAGNHTLSIEKLATRSKLMGDVIKDPYQALGLDGTIKINGKELSLTRDMTASDLVGAINADTKYKASAVIVSGRLLVTSLDTGKANGLSFEDTSGEIIRSVSSDRNILFSKISDPSAVASGTYTMEVSQLAQKHTVSSGTMADITKAVGYEGTLTINGVNIKIEGNDSAKTIVDKINDETGANVKASISGGKLTLESNVMGAAGAINVTDSTTKSGESGGVFNSFGILGGSGNFSNVTKDAQDAKYTVNGISHTSSDNIDRSIAGVETTIAAITTEPLTLTVEKSTGNLLQSLGILNANGDIKNQIEVGQDAKYSVNGISLESASNTVTDAINGVTFELLKKTTAEVNITFAKDNEDLQTKIKDFVTTYNDALVKMNRLVGEEGEMQGQILPNQIKNALQRAVFGDAATGSSLTLFQVGIELDGISKDGTLKLDETKLANMLKTNAVDVAKLFEGTESISGAMYKILDNTTKTNGAFTNKLNGIQSTLTGIQKSLDRNSSQYEQMKTSLILKYAKFDVAMSSLNSMSMQMTALFKGINGNSNSN